MILAVFLIYILLVIQFQSLAQPFVILVVIPCSLIGVAAGLLVSGSPFGVLSFVGIVGLTGIVVNDAIVLLTYFNTLIKEGYTAGRALGTASLTRLRPILLTSVTTIAGLLPLTLGAGGGGEFWKPLGWSVIWGLLASTLLTLLIIPLLNVYGSGIKRAEAVRGVTAILRDRSTDIVSAK
jgi:HAE1 family hydrophobic/amphiphilic exporter-1